MTDHVIVIGAGFAGLSAATSLAEQGVRVLVLEARPSLGGRASVFTDPATGERVDNGQHVLIGAYRETFRFLRRLGTAQHVYMQPGLAVDIIDRDGRTSRLACPAIPAPLHLLVGALRWNAIGWRDRMALVRMRHAGSANWFSDSWRRVTDTLQKSSNIMILACILESFSNKIH